MRAAGKAGVERARVGERPPVRSSRDQRRASIMPLSDGMGWVNRRKRGISGEVRESIVAYLILQMELSSGVSRIDLASNRRVSPATQGVGADAVGQRLSDRRFQ